MKDEISTSPLFFEKQQVPMELFNMLQYAQSLSFEKEPNYKYLK
jgi:hypothetical protein